MSGKGKEGRVPQIRFAGFTDPWEQRKLGELFEESDQRSATEEILMEFTQPRNQIERRTPVQALQITR